MKTNHRHAVTAAMISPALAALPTFPAFPEPTTGDGCAFFSAADAAALGLKAYYAACEQLSALTEPDHCSSGFDFACLFADALVVRLSALAWSSGIDCHALHPVMDLRWPRPGDSVQEWRQAAPGFLDEILKCLPLLDNREKLRRKGKR